MNRRVRAASIVVLLALAAGCGASGDDAPAVSEPAPGTSSQGSEEPNSDLGRGKVDVRDELTQFVDPGGNIGCAIDRDFARCDIAERSWKPPRAPRSCDLDFGQGITVAGNDKSRFVCAGDTTLGADETVPHDQTIQVGPFGCRSDEQGMVCTNEDSGHGFLIGRTEYDLF